MKHTRKVRAHTLEEWRQSLDVAFRLGYKWDINPFDMWEGYYTQNPEVVLLLDSSDLSIAYSIYFNEEEVIEAKEFIESSLNELAKITSYAIRPKSKDGWNELVSAAIAKGFTWYSGGTDLKSYIYDAGTNYLDFWIDGSQDITYHDSTQELDAETLLVSAETVKWYFNQLSDEETTDLPVTKIDNDVVEHPAHYNEYSGFEVIDVIEQVSPKYEKQVAYHIGNTLKYIMRAPFKGKTKEDLEKAQWYLSRAISLLSEEK